MVTAKKTAKTPAKAPAKVAAVKRSTPKPKPAPEPKPEPKHEPKNQTNVDKIIGLIEWVDNPFKLFTVILLSFLFFAGYFAWDSRQVILQAITTQDKMPQLAKQEDLLPPAQSLLKDVDGLKEKIRAKLDDSLGEEALNSFNWAIRIMNEFNDRLPDID
jgi:hypothetical protein